MSRGPDAATLLARALRAAAATCGCSTQIVAASMTRWASATFTGARHQVTLSGPCSDTADRWLADLPDAEWALRGHLVADVAVQQVTREAGSFTACIEALTLEEG